MRLYTKSFSVSLGVIFLLSFFLISPCQLMASNVKKIALVMKALTNPFFIKLDQGAREYAKQHDIPLEVFGLDRETNIEHQISIIDNLISRDYGAIIIAPSDSKRLIPICKKALEKGLKVINIDNPLDKETLDKQGISIPFIGPDNFAGGELIGKYIRSKLNEKGQVLLIEGIPGASNSDNRKNGFIKGVTQNSSIEIVRIEQANWHRDEAFSAVLKALEELGAVDAIVCTNDVMALGALQALEVSGISSKVLIAGYDNIDQVREEMRTNRIHATIEQHPEIMGAYGVKAAWQSLQGIPPAPEQALPLKLITSDHMGKKIVFSVSTLDNPFFSIMVASAVEEASLLGINITVLDANNQDAKQLVEIVTALEKETDFLLINPTNSATISPVIEVADSMGVPIITVDRRIANEKVLSHIASDNRAGGRMVAEFIVKQLGGRGKLLELEGIPGTSAAHNRGAGFNEEINKYKDITIDYREVAGFDRQRAKSVVTRLLDEGLKVDAVFAHNDNMILGLIDAYETAGIGLPPVLVGFDGIETAIRYIKKGKLSATVAQRPDIMGKLAVESAAMFFRGVHLSSEIPVDLKLIEE